MGRPNNDILKQVIVEQRETFLRTEGYIDREILNHPDFTKIYSLKEIVVFTGVRRCGKSFLMRLVWQQLRQQKNLPANNFLYVNFEDEKLFGFEAVQFDDLLAAYQTSYNPDLKKKIYLFFDEIQIIPGWDKFLHRLAEDDRYKIFVTGSNATLLSKEISTALTGRNVQIKVFPLSFREYVKFVKEETLDLNQLLTAVEKAKISHLFKQYEKSGGFPEVVLQKFRPLLQEYLKNIIYRDIVLRRHIRYEASLREVVAFVVNNIGVPVSLNNVAKMTGVKNLMTVKNYLSYLEDSFLFFSLPRFSYSIKQQIYNPDKFYLVDTGLYYEVSSSTSENYGRILENLVFLELQRRNYNIFYFSGAKNECDFVVGKKNVPEIALQVTLELGPQNEDREINGLQEAMTTLKLKSGLILIKDDSDKILIGNKTITVMPVWQWLLEK